MINFIKRMMEKKVIGIDTEKINQTNILLIDTIGIINKYTNSLNNLGLVLTIEDVRNMALNNKDFVNYAYKKELKSICKQFGMNYEEIASFTYQIRAGNPMFSNMANNRIKDINQLSKELCNLLYSKCLDCLKHIEIVNNIAAPTLTATEDIADENTFYCLNKKQERLTDGLNQIKVIYEDLHKLGLSYYELHNLLDNSNELYFRTIQKIE